MIELLIYSDNSVDTFLKEHFVTKKTKTRITINTQLVILKKQTNIFCFLS